MTCTGERQCSSKSDSSVCSKANWGNFTRFRHQAQQVWEEQEAQWEKERKARERLMQEVDWFHIPIGNFASC